YRPFQLGDNEYEVTLTEFIRGQIAPIIFGIPLSLFVAGLVGTLWPTGRWPVFVVVFGVWGTMMIMGILSAPLERGSRCRTQKDAAPARPSSIRERSLG